MIPVWRDWPGDCPACGNDVEVCTAAEPDPAEGTAVYDGDDARCVSCGWRGARDVPWPGRRR